MKSLFFWKRRESQTLEQRTLKWELRGDKINISVHWRLRSKECDINICIPEQWWLAASCFHVICLLFVNDWSDLLASWDTKTKLCCSSSSLQTAEFLFCFVFPPVWSELKRSESFLLMRWWRFSNIRIKTWWQTRSCLHVKSWRSSSANMGFIFILLT